MKYHPHIYNRYNPRQPYYGMPNYNGALSWYSQPFVEGILFSPRWKEEQKEWINGVIYFNKTSVSNELKGWNHWKSGQDFSELFLYIVMSMIFETQSPLSDYNHAYFTNVYVMSRGMTNTTEKIALVEVVIEHLKDQGIYPDTLSDLAYAYTRMLTYYNIAVTDAVIDTFSANQDLPPSPLSDEEREAIQTQIEFQRKKKGDKSKKERMKLNKKQKIIVGVSAGTLSIGLFTLMVLLARRK